MNGYYGKRFIIKSRFAFTIQIPRIFIYLIAIFLSFILCLFIVIQPIFFSPYSPIYKRVRMFKFEENYEEYQTGKYRELYIYEVYYSHKIENVTFDVEGRTCTGLIHYCQRSHMNYNQSINLVDECVWNVKIEMLEEYKGYESVSEKFTCVNHTLNLADEVDGLFVYKITIISFLIAEEVFGRKRYTLVKKSQTPKLYYDNHKDDDNNDSIDIKDVKFEDEYDEREPFILSNANADKFGKITLSVGTLVSPKFKETDTLLNKYGLSFKKDVEKDLKDEKKKKSGFFKVMATSSKSENERVLESFTMKSLYKANKLEFFKIFYEETRVMILYILMILLMIVMIIFMATSSLYDPEDYITVSVLVILYFLLFGFFIVGVFQKLFNHKILVTDKRIISTWKAYFQCRIDHLFYDDIEEISIVYNKTIVYNKIQVKIKHDLLLELNKSLKWEKLQDKHKTIINGKEVPFIKKLNRFLTTQEKIDFVENIKRMKNEVSEIIEVEVGSGLTNTEEEVVKESESESKIKNGDTELKE